MSDDDKGLFAIWQHLLVGSAWFMQTLTLATVLYASPLYWKQPYHTSSLSGEEWIKELVYGHPDRIRNELGVRLHVFLALVLELRNTCGLTHSRHLVLEEQLGIFLYMCVTGLSIQHVGERFQRSNETVSKYFKQILFALSSPAFYNKYVHLPESDNPPPSAIQDNPKFWPFLAGAIGAMDGTHIPCCPSAEERVTMRNRKGFTSQNCLACCDWNMKFLYFVSGWEGAAADATMYEAARIRDFLVPQGKYYLADAGFGLCNSLLVPYRGVRYHLAEWGRAGVRPANREELFNLRHASARNVMERIFGIKKKRFAVLNRTPQFDMAIQTRIPPALAAVHNFIIDHDPTDLELFDDDVSDSNPGVQPTIREDLGVLTVGPADRHEKEMAARCRDQIAQDMWDSYQAWIAENPSNELE